MSDLLRIEKKKLKKSQILFGLVTVAMFVVVMAFVGDTLRNPLVLSLEPEYVDAIGSSGERVVLVDQDSSRLSIATSDGQVENIVNVDPDKPSGEQYSVAYIDENNLYYATATGDPSSAYFASEQVYQADTSGNDRTLVYQRTLDEGDKVAEPSFTKIVAGDDDVLLLRVDQSELFVEVISLAKTPGETVARKSFPEGVAGVLSVDYDAASGQLALVSSLRNIYVGSLGGDLAKVDAHLQNAVFTDCAWGDNGCLYCVNPNSMSIVCLDPRSGESASYSVGTTPQCITRTADGSSIACGLADGYAVFKTADFTPTSPNPASYATNSTLPYSAFFAFRILIFWIALVYLVVCAVVLLAKTAIRMKNEGKSASVVRTALIGVCALLLVGVSIFFAYQFYTFAEETRYETVASLCEMGTKTVEANYAEMRADQQQGDGLSGTEKTTYLERAGEKLLVACESFSDNDIGLRAIIVLRDGDDVFLMEVNPEWYGYRTITVGESEVGGEAATSFAHGSADETAQEYLNSTGSGSLVAYRAVQDSSGNSVGLVMTTCEDSDLAESYTSLCIELAMSLLAVLGAALLVVLEGKGLFEASRMRIREKKSGSGHPEAWASRPLVFLSTMAWGCDSTIVVLIAQEMLTDAGATNIEVLVGLPAMAVSIGGLVGTVSFNWLAAKVSARKLLIAGAVVACASLALSFFAVQQNAFYVFCAFKFITGLGAGLLATVAYALPLCADDEEKRAQLFHNCTMTALSGGALGSLVCGYVAQYFGNSWVYAVCAIPTLYTVFAALRLLPAGVFASSNDDDGEDSSSREAKKKKMRTLLSFFFSIPVLSMLIGTSIPMILAGGYKSVLFPLFMSDGGLSKTYINNIVVLSNIIVFALSPKLAGLFKGVGQLKLATAATLLSGVVLVWFVVNTTVAWGILALVLLALCAKVYGPAKLVLLPREARARGVSEARADNSDNVVYSVVSGLRSPILSTLAGLGQSVACLCVGVCCLVGAGIFALGTSRSAMRDDANAPSQDEAGAQDQTE